MRFRQFEPADDHGDDRASATRVAVPSDTDGTLTVGDTDYFRFDISGSGVLKVYSSGTTNTTGRLEDPDGRLRLADDDSGEGLNFRVASYVTSGTYYLRVKGSSLSTTGRYTLHARLDPLLDDHGNDRASATRIAVPSDTSAELSEADADFFRLEVSGFGKLRVYTSGDTRTHGFLLDESGNTRGEHLGGSLNLNIESFVTSGTYYVRVIGFSPLTTGRYTLHVRFDADDHGNNRASATSVAVPSDTPGALFDRDTDYFSFSVSGSGSLQVYTSGPVNTLGRLEDSRGNPLRNDNDSGSNTNFRIEEFVRDGTYYVRVTAVGRLTTGNYTLHVRFSESPSDDHGDTRETATTVGAPSTTRGEIDTPVDLDFFVFHLAQPGRLIVGTTGNTDTFGSLLGPGGIRQSDSSSGDGPNFRIVRDNSPAGTYFVVVQAGSELRPGRYELHVTVR